MDTTKTEPMEEFTDWRKDCFDVWKATYEWAFETLKQAFIAAIDPRLINTASTETISETINTTTKRVVEEFEAKNLPYGEASTHSAFVAFIIGKAAEMVSSKITPTPEVKS